MKLDTPPDPSATLTGQPVQRQREAAFTPTGEKERGGPGRPWQPLQRRESGPSGSDSSGGAVTSSSLPPQLQNGIEALSGLSMEGVRVHRGSAKPAQVQALAYTQGQDIYLGPGHERHLPHEAWHVVQQKQGRVQATRQLKGLGLNDDARLEREADTMGERAVRWSGGPATDPRPSQPLGAGAIQRQVEQSLPEGTPVKANAGTYADQVGVIRQELKDKGYRVEFDTDQGDVTVDYSYEHLDPVQLDEQEFAEQPEQPIIDEKDQVSDAFSDVDLQEDQPDHEEVTYFQPPQQQGSDLHQPFQQISELLETAESFRESYKTYVTTLARSVGGRALVNFLVKGKGSAQRKLYQDYLEHAKNQPHPQQPPIPQPDKDDTEAWDQFNASGMFDLLRSTIVVKNAADLQKLSKMIESYTLDIRVRRKKNRYFGGSSKPKDDFAQKSGYRDIQYVLEFHPKSLKKKGLPMDFLAELQLNTESQIIAKEIEHPIYELKRKNGSLMTDEEYGLVTHGLEEGIRLAKALGYETGEVTKILNIIKQNRQYVLTEEHEAVLTEFSQKIYGNNEADLMKQMRRSLSVRNGQLGPTFNQRSQRNILRTGPNQNP